MKQIFLIIFALMTFFSCTKQEENSIPLKTDEKVCVLQTNLGKMVFRFFEKDAPITSRQFQKLVNDGFYDGRSFYRVVKGHVIQAGDQGKSKTPSVKAEFNKNLHIVGAVGLARDNNPDSGSSEFYICLAPRPHLDGKYTVFGQLIKGLDILEKIGNVEVDDKFVGDAKIAFHKPKEPVIIKKASIELQKLSD